jgi:hypothetical protein
MIDRPRLASDAALPYTPKSRWDAALGTLVQTKTTSATEHDRPGAVGWVGLGQRAVSIGAKVEPVARGRPADSSGQVVFSCGSPILDRTCHHKYIAQRSSTAHATTSLMTRFRFRIQFLRLLTTLPERGDQLLRA